MWLLRSHLRHRLGLRRINAARFAGEVGAVGVVVVGDVGLRRFTGWIGAGQLEGPCCWYLWRKELPRGAALCALAPHGHERHARLAALPGLGEAVSLLSGRAGSLQFQPRGVQLHDYRRVPAGILDNDVAQAVAIARALAGWRDPPLLDALRAGDLDLLRRLVAEGQSPLEIGPGIVDLAGRSRTETPLLRAIATRDRPALGLLLSAADITRSDVGDAAGFAVELRDPELLADLIPPRDPRLATNDLTSLLDRAVNAGWLEGTRFLLEAGADASAVREPGRDADPAIRALLAERSAARPQDPVSVAIRRKGRPVRRLGSWIARLWQPATARSVRAAAESLGLTREGAAFAGLHRGIALRLEERRGGVVQIRAEAGIHPEIRAEAEPLHTRLGVGPDDAWAAPHQGEVVTRDDGFDRSVAVHGPSPEALALLSPGVRARLRGFVVELGGTLREGAVLVESRDPAALVALAEAAVDIASLLAERQRRGTLVNLHEGAVKEPSDYIRVAMLEALATRHPGTPELREAALRALEGWYDWLRLHGAGKLEEEGVAACRKMLADPHQRPQCRASAMISLVDRGLLGEEELLVHARDEQPLLAVPAIRRLGDQLGGVLSVEPLMAIEAKGGEAGRAATTALTAIRARLRNAEPGTLTLASPDPERGAVSLDPAEQGGPGSHSP